MIDKLKYLAENPVSSTGYAMSLSLYADDAMKIMALLESAKGLYTGDLERHKKLFDAVTALEGEGWLKSQIKFEG